MGVKMPTRFYPQPSSSNILPQMRPDPKTFGSIRGCPIGTTWPSRKACSDAGVHPGIMKGIYGTAAEGARSIVLNGGYEDDEDRGDIFTYTGSGGRTLVTRDGKSLRTGPQTHDQTFDHSPNRALYRSWQTRKPVRVIRGSQLNSVHAPADGYRYDGLYRVTKAWEEKGKAGYIVCRYTLERLPDQPPLLRLSYAQTLANIHKSDKAKRRETKRARSPPITFKDERPKLPNPPPLSFISDKRPHDQRSSPIDLTNEDEEMNQQPEAGPSRLPMKRERSDSPSVSPFPSSTVTSPVDEWSRGPKPIWIDGQFKFHERSHIVKSEA